MDTLERQEKEETDERIKKQQAAAKAFEEARQQDSIKKKEIMKEWTEEELRMLDKALNKFPQVRVLFCGLRGGRAAIFGCVMKGNSEALGSSCELYSDSNA